VTEAKRPDGERFGNDRLIEALNEDILIDDESLILRVKAAVDRFSGDEPQYDDMTMLSFTYYGESGNETDS
jgi:sigma-B regulation protein RsbU (phosphoserine phosphatase)